jgi:hypothetical protein
VLTPTRPFGAQAISNPSDAEAQSAAWGAVTPLVMLLKVFFDYSSEVEQTLIVLLETLCSQAPLPMLEKKQVPRMCGLVGKRNEAEYWCFLFCF